MSVPTIINDGDWDSLATPLEGMSYDFPFSDKGDFTTFKALVPFKQNIEAYRPRALMTARDFTLGRAYLTKLGSPRNTSCGIFEWEDTYSSVPVARSEYGTFNYTMQWWRAIADANVNPDKYFYDVNYDIEEQTFTVPCEWRYEYFANAVPDPLIKPRVFLLFGFLQTIGGTPAPSGLIIAEDSAVSIYEGQIYERRTAYARIRVATPVT